MTDFVLMRTVAVSLVLLFLSGCYGVCKPYCKKDPFSDKPLIVKEAQIQKDEDEGWYEVTEGWFTDRMEYEQGLQDLIDDLRAKLEAMKEIDG